MPKDSDLMTYAYLKFPSKNGEPFEVRSEKVTISKTDGNSGYAVMLKQLMEKVEAFMQSGHAVKLKDFEI
eukprot:16343573-Heterocapsa_arctica.AAC.1